MMQFEPLDRLGGWLMWILGMC